MLRTFPIDDFFTYINAGSYDAVFQSGPQGAIASLESSLTVDDLSSISSSYGIYASANDGASGPSACVETPAMGGPTTWPTTPPCTGLPSGTNVSIVVYPRGAGAFPRTLHVYGTVTMDYTPGGTTFDSILDALGPDGCDVCAKLDRILAAVTRTYSSF